MVICAVVFLASIPQAIGQVNLENPPLVPDALERTKRDDLSRERVQLVAIKAETEESVSKLNSQCSKVDSKETARIADCRARNSHLRETISAYRVRLNAYKCALVAGVRNDIAKTQQALRSLGIGTTVEEYQALEQVGRQEMDAFVQVLVESVVDYGIGALGEAAEKGLLVVAGTGTAQGQKYRRLAEALGANNPHFLEAVTAFANARDKPAKAKALIQLVHEGKLIGKVAYAQYSIARTKNSEELLLQYGAFWVMLLEEAAPHMAKELASKYPTMAVGAAKHLTLTVGTTVAAPIATFIQDMRLLRATDEAIRALDAGVDLQLQAVGRLHERMIKLTKQLRGLEGHARCDG